MSDYMPTTEEVRSSATCGNDYSHVTSNGFDVWLAVHEAEIRASEREKAALKPERFSEVAESILNAWMEHIGYSAEQVTAALETGHANCEFIDYGYDCFDDEGISRHPILDEIDGMEQIVVFVMERLAAARGGEQDA